MHLKKMEITGFKSFVDKTAIEFPAGISAIVGPNGCGKSNIVDALRWAMGEQSVKQLRGKAMEDVIFAGTNGRPPLNMAEVSLVLSNENGDAPEEFKEYTEIYVTRRLFRSGESAYLINKQPCRLKDIHNLLLGSGVGTKSYSLIQQGNIGAITEAGPEERRIFLEEAAGITRYKNRRAEALQKVDATKANLLRLSDIISEVERQMASLKRQAKKAELYKDCQSRIRELDVALAFHYHRELISQIRETDILLKGLKDADIEHTTKIKQLDAAVEEIKLNRIRKTEEIQEKKSDRFETQRRIDRLENEISHLRKEVERLETETVDLQSLHETLELKNQNILSEVAQAEQENIHLKEEIQTASSNLEQERKASEIISIRLSGLNNELNSFRARVTELVAREAQYKNIHQTASNNKESLKRRLKRIDEEEVVANKQVKDFETVERKASENLKSIQEELTDLNQLIDALRLELDEKGKALGTQVKLTQSLELERNKVKSRYNTLKKMEENFEWYKDGVKAIMKRAAEEGSEPHSNAIIGLVADIIEPKPEFETAVEAVLGESLQYILVKDQHTGIDAIEYLKTQEAGRSGFIPVSLFSQRPLSVTEDRGDLLLNHVDIKSGFESIAKMLLENVMIAPDMKEAIRMNGSGKTIVTKNGDMISHQNIMVGGSKDKLSGILAKKMELKDLEKQVTTLTLQWETARQDQKNLESELRDLESDLQQQVELKNRVTKSELEAEKNLYKVTEDLKHARRQLEVIRMEQDKLMGEETDIDLEIEKYNRLVAQVTQEINDAQNAVAKTSDEIAAVSAQMESHNRRIVDFKLNLTTLNAKLENSASTLRRLKEFREDGIKRLEQLTRDIAQKNEKLLGSKKKITEYEQALSIMYDGIKELERAIESNEAEYQLIDNRLKESDSSISSIQKEREETLEKIRMLELEQSQRRLKCENIDNRLKERYSKSFNDFMGEFGERTIEAAPEKMEEELAEFRKKAANMGDVNMGAIAEYEQLQERFTFLDAQRTDLLQAIDDLHKVIRKINQISQERFMETFNQINEKLNEVFPRLFDGGSAQLTLTEPDKPLETGVEFMVHPPGKKLTRLSLLSGGEKALSAIAFIFSIFLIKPTAFCIMDEIDAPLDEANVLRFNDLMKIIGEKSQIIMITHKKKSMEFADVLFGVTMEKKGISKIVSVNFNRTNETLENRVQEDSRENAR